MQGDPIDRLLRRAFQRHRPDVDPKALWSAIEPEVPQKKRRKRRLWLWLPLAGVGLLALLWPVFLETDRGGKSDLPPLEAPPLSGEQPSAITEAATEDSLYSTLAPVFAKKRRELPVLRSPLPGSRIPENHQFTTVQIPQLPPFLHGSRRRLAPLPALGAGDMQVTRSTAHYRPLPVSAPDTMLLSSLPVRKRASPGGTEADALKKVIRPLRRSAGLWEVEVSAGANYAVSRFSGPAAYVESRQRTETGAPGSQFELLFGRRNAAGWRVAAGLSYTILGQQFQFQEKRDTVVERELTTAFWVRSERDTVFFTESLQTPQQITRSVRHYNTYRLWDLPVQIDYQLTRGRWLFGLGGGAVINLSARSRGRMLSDSGQVVDLENDDARPFRRSWGLSAFGEAALGWRYTRSGTMLLQPGLQYTPGNVLAVDGVGKQGFWTYSLQIGIRQQFKNAKSH